MKSTGVVRKVDELGRIVVPIEVRKVMGIVAKDNLEIIVDGNSIILKKHCSSCMFCGDTGELVSCRGKMVCRKCIGELYSL